MNKPNFLQKIVRYKKSIYSKYTSLKKLIPIKLPQKCDVIIYDDIRSESILEYIDSSKSVFILKTRELCIYFNLELFLKILKKIFSKKFISSICINGINKGLLKYSLDLYHEAIIKKLNPSVVVSVIDNQPRFGRLSISCSQIRFIAIQNGCRSSWETNLACKQDIYLNFSNRDSITLRKLGWEINQSVSFGSLNAARVFASIKNEKVKRDLLIISSWRGNIEMDKDYFNQFDAMQEMHFYLNNLVRKERYKASIILRSQKNDQHWYIKKYASNEEDFYKRIYGDNCEILQNNVLGYDVYRHINNSYLSVAFLTSAILEGYLYGHKCLYLNFYKNNYYHKDFPVDTVINKNDLALMSLKIKNQIRESRKIHQEITTNSKTKSNQTLDRFKKILNENIK